MARVGGEGGGSRQVEKPPTRRRVDAFENKTKDRRGKEGGKGGGGKGGGRGKVDEPYGTIEGREGRLVSIHPSSSELEEGGEKQAKKVRGEGGR